MCRRREAEPRRQCVPTQGLGTSSRSLIACLARLDIGLRADHRRTRSDCLVFDFYADAGPQLAIGGVMLELLLGSLILRWGVAFRNRLSDWPIGAPSFGKALGIVGLSLLVTVPAAVGLMGALYVAAASSDNGSRSVGVGEAVWTLAWIFLPFAFVAYFLLRAGIVSWLLRIDLDDALVVQICEMLIYFVAALVLGLVAFVILLLIQ